MGFATEAIHAGQRPDPSTGSVITPIYATSTYAQEAIGVHKGYEYSRTHNPTRQALEANIAALERGRRGVAFSSGMAAISAVMSLLRSGDHVIASHDLYGGTYRLFTRLLVNYGLKFSFLDATDASRVERAITSETRLVYIETPTNPLMTIADIRAVAEICRARGLKLVVDNTFMSPYFQRPLALGADIVVHSTTKYLNGHSDSVGGIAVAAGDEDGERLAFVQNSVGAILSPFESWLVLRGTKTLAVRMRQHDENGRAVARFLAGHRKVLCVHYPGLPDHPQHELARRQMSGFGGMISFDVGSFEKANRLLQRVRLCTLAESLGGVETLISHPATMTHASLSAEQRAALGITDGLVRISVGLEDVEDIIADLEQALAAI